MPKQYFQMFPKIAYDIDGDANNFKVVTDVMRRVRVKMQELSDKVIYDRYSMQDGETIESVAYKFYGSPTYHWVLLLLNNIKGCFRSTRTNRVSSCNNLTRLIYFIKIYIPSSYCQRT